MRQMFKGGDKILSIFCFRTNIKILKKEVQ